MTSNELCQNKTNKVAYAPSLIRVLTVGMEVSLLDILPTLKCTAHSDQTGGCSSRLRKFLTVAMINRIDKLIIIFQNITGHEVLVKCENKK